MYVSTGRTQRAQRLLALELSREGRKARTGRADVRTAAPDRPAGNTPQRTRETPVGTAERFPVTFATVLERRPP